MYDNYFKYQQLYGNNKLFDGFRKWYEDNLDYVNSAPDMAKIWKEYIGYRNNRDANTLIDGKTVIPAGTEAWKAVTDSNLDTLRAMRERFNGGGTQPAKPPVASDWSRYSGSMRKALGY